MPLKQIHKKKITINYKEIIETLNVDSILDSLISSDVITFDDSERIQSKCTQREKNREFIQCLLRGPHKGFDLFVKELKADESYKELAEKIKKTIVREKNPEATGFSDNDIEADGEPASHPSPINRRRGSNPTSRSATPSPRRAIHFSRRATPSPRCHRTSRSPFQSAPVFNIQGCGAIQIGDGNRVVGDQNVQGTNISGSNKESRICGEDNSSDSSSEPTSLDSEDPIEEPIHSFGGRAEESFDNFGPNDETERVYETSEDDACSGTTSDEEKTFRKVGGNNNGDERRGGDDTCNEISLKLSTRTTKPDKKEGKDYTRRVVDPEIQVLTFDGKTQSQGCFTTSISMNSEDKRCLQGNTSLEIMPFSDYWRGRTRRKYCYWEQFRRQTNKNSEYNVLYDDDVD